MAVFDGLFGLYYLSLFHVEHCIGSLVQTQCQVVLQPDLIGMLDNQFLGHTDALVEILLLIVGLAEEEYHFLVIWVEMVRCEIHVDAHL